MEQTFHSTQYYTNVITLRIVINCIIISCMKHYYALGYCKALEARWYTFHNFGIRLFEQLIIVLMRERMFFYILQGTILYIT